AVDAANIERGPVAVQGDIDGVTQSFGDAQVGGEEIGGSGGQDAEDHARAGHGVDDALHHPVAAPHEYEVGTALKGLGCRLGRLLALGHLEPQRVGDTFDAQEPAQLGETATERLPGVGQHRHAGHDGTRAWSTTCPRSCTVTASSCGSWRSASGGAPTVRGSKTTSTPAPITRPTATSGRS